MKIEMLALESEFVQFSDTFSKKLQLKPVQINELFDTKIVMSHRIVGTA